MSRFSSLVKKTFYILFFSFSLTNNAFSSCKVEKLTVLGKETHWVFDIEVADDPVTRTKGLMNRKSLELMHGMVFIYKEPSKLVFWMKNTLIPLDIIFFDEKGIIKSIHKNTKPLSEKKIFGGSNLIGALEINGGLSSELGIKLGDIIQTIYLDRKKAIRAC